MPNYIYTGRHPHYQRGNSGLHIHTKSFSNKTWWDMMQRIDVGSFNRLDHYRIHCACLIKGENLLRKQIACSLTPVNHCGFQHETSLLFLWISIAVACGLICIIAHLPSPKLVGTTPAPYQYVTHLSFLLNPSKWLTHYVGQRYINVCFF